MSGRFEGRSAVVTGGSSGIGAGCVDRLQAEGATVAVLDAAAANAVDVTDEAAVEAFFEALPAPADILVNAAGIGAGARIVDLELEEWRRVLAVNLDGTFLALRAMARRAVAAGRPGAVVNITSINERWPLTGFGPYCASKAGVAMLTKVAALELGPAGIRVNAVAPGPIETPLVAMLRTIPGADAAVEDRTPLPGSWGRVEDVAAAVVWLCSDDARWVTGCTLDVDGGQMLRGEPDFVRLAEGALRVR